MVRPVPSTCPHPPEAVTTEEIGHGVVTWDCSDCGHRWQTHTDD